MATSTANVTEYDLFIDESGTFMERSTDAAERAEDAASGKTFPSQLAGLLVPRGALTEQQAQDILQHSHNVVGWTLPQVVHLNKYWKDPAYFQDQKSFNIKFNKFVSNVLEQLNDAKRGYQPVRLVNSEGVRYGTKAQHYTNMVAELFIRICRQKQREGLQRVSISLTCAKVLLKIPNKKHLTKDEYEKRLREHIAVAAVRRGLAADSREWELKSLTLEHANISRRLQICDVISYPSHDDFIRLDDNTKRRFETVLGYYNWTLQVRDLLERVENLRGDGSLGSAIITLVESSLQGGLSNALLTEAERARGRVLDDLAAALAPVRDSQLSIILSWLEQAITLQRSTALGFRVALWLKKWIGKELISRLSMSGRSSEIDWFIFGLHYWALTACNHEGDLLSAREMARELEGSIPALAGRWEHTPLLMECLVALAVHETDCLEFQHASARMELVAGYYEKLGALFSTAMPEVFTTPIHSDMRGKALGTWVQSEILAGAGNFGCAEKARAISEKAIQEFGSEDDKERQYQYRAQLESSAGDFAMARHFLARSLRLQSVTHDAIGRAIEKLDTKRSRRGSP